MGLDVQQLSQEDRRIEICEDLSQLRAIPPVDGVVHLAGVSRVIDGERNPKFCWQSNVNDFQRLLRLMASMAVPPWVVYSSSREVYGEPSRLPVDETAPLAPVNVYGRSKVAAEALVADYARLTRQPAQVLRFSNVYGHTRDHATRVVPAFVRAALDGRPIEIQGKDHVFDFTHVDDAARAVVLATRIAQEGRQLPTMHILPGEASTLDDLASSVAEATGASLDIRRAPGRSYDVSRFHGDPSLMHRELGMTCAIRLKDGVSKLVRAFQEALLCA